MAVQGTTAPRRKTPSRRASKPPAYRKRVIRGRDIAYLSLTDSQTKKRRDFWLGPFGSAESRERYACLVAEWESSGRHLTDHRGPDLAISQLVLAYWKSIQGHYSPGEMRNIQHVIRLLRQHCGSMPAAEFGPNTLRLVREAMATGDPSTDPPRRPWIRGSCNRQTTKIRAIWKWAASRELLSIAVYRELCSLEPLKHGRTNAPESIPVTPAPEHAIEAVKRLVSRQIAAMIDLQLLTGMRPGEVCSMRACDLDLSGEIWLYRPVSHKNTWRGKGRTIHLGPVAQDAIRPFLCRAVTAHLFSPAEAVADRRAARHAARRTPLSCGNRPGTNVKDAPRRQALGQYTSVSYGRAVRRACDKADAIEKKKRDMPPDSERVIPHWHPHQLRHNAATTFRRLYGLEAAQVLLGHGSAAVTDAVYAERDERKAREIAAKIG